MLKNILIGGEAGQGIDTVASILEAIINKNGYYIFTIKDYMSRVRGGHNFVQIRFGNEKNLSHSDDLDLIIALDEKTINAHSSGLKKDGLIICDEEIKNDNEKIKKLPFRKIGKEIGNVKIANIVMVGVVLKLYGMDYSFLKDILKNVFKDEKLFDINFKAAQKVWI